MRDRRSRVVPPVFVFLLAILFVLARPQVVPAAAGGPPPRPQGYVSDYAGILSTEERGRLEGLAATLERETTAQLAVVTVQSTAPDDPKAYAVWLFESWGIGQKGKDNGVLILVALDERRVEVEVGYGLEPILTDGRVGRILDDHVVPRFREQAYGEGLLAGAAAIVELVTREAGEGGGSSSPPADAVRRSPRPGQVGTVLGVLLCVGGLWFLLGRLLGPRCPRCRSRLRAKQRVLEVATATMPGLAVSIYECLRCGFTREKKFRIPRRLPPPVIRRRPWGGSGGFGAGSMGGRGFGGFGGGRSGGGGAGRRW